MKYMERWPKCDHCDTLRPPDALERHDDHQFCSDQDWCDRQKRYAETVRGLIKIARRKRP